MPTVGSGKSPEIQNPYLTVGTESYAIVNEVYGIPLQDQMSLDSLTFARLFRDAFCYKMLQSNEGKEYLEKCWRMKQTRPDVEGLRKKFSK